MLEIRHWNWKDAGKGREGMEWGRTILELSGKMLELEECKNCLEECWKQAGRVLEIRCKEAGIGRM